MTTYYEDEGSAQSSLAVEYFDIALSTGQIYRVAAGERNIQIGSNLYEATACVRSEFSPPQIDGAGGRDLTLTLPVTHAVVKRWFQTGVPPRLTTVTAWRQQARSLASVQQWIGLVTSIACEGNLAKLLIPAQIIQNTQRFLPTVTTAPTCPYILYDLMCQVARASFVVSTTAQLVQGRDIRFDLGDLAKLGDWTVGGELLHVPSGERMTIAKQTDVNPPFSSVTVVSMQLPIPDLKTGDAINVYAGCDHIIQTCKNKFANQDRFGGYPDAALVNPFLPGGSGLLGT